MGLGIWGGWGGSEKGRVNVRVDYCLNEKKVLGDALLVRVGGFRTLTLA